MVTRRHFLKLGAAAGISLILPWDGIVPRLVHAQTPLDPFQVPKFVNPMPVINALRLRKDVTGGGTVTVRMEETTQDLLGLGFQTKVWGYGWGDGITHDSGPVTYPGLTFVAKSGVPVQVQWINNLPHTNGHLLPVDTTLHWAYGHTSHTIADDGVPVVPHLHGGRTESDSDGLPEYWWSHGDGSTGATGPRFDKSLYYYGNSQEAGTLWYHDHALGITRLNVYAGLAGFYLLRDDHEDALILSNQIPGDDYEIELVIQDRMFDTNGQLYYPSLDPAILLNPTALPEFFGDVILVNGKAWPFLNVEPTKYRFRLLNGSDSRFYNLRVNSGAADTPGLNGPQIIQIGTDDGFMDVPVWLDRLTIGPGERADIVIDFAGWEGQTLIVRNNARSPFDKGVTPNPQLDGQIMAFNVGLTATAAPVTLPASLRPDGPYTVQGPVVKTRQLLLFEGTDKYGRLQPMLGTIDPTLGVLDGTLLWDDPITENPKVGTTEIWEVFNATMDAHPIHTHLEAFQVLGRQKYTATIVPKDNFNPMAPNDLPSIGGTLTSIRLKGRLKPPEANELGPKDTAQMYPGEVTRIKIHFGSDLIGRYVWHCHILSHEDHEMMRPYHVRTYADAYPQPASYWLGYSDPNLDTYDPTWLKVSPYGTGEIFLSGVTYADALSIGTGALGAPWYKLAAACIAAQLNIAAGGNPGTVVASSLDGALGLLGSHPPTNPVDASQYEAFRSVIDAWNNSLV